MNMEYNRDEITRKHRVEQYAGRFIAENHRDTPVNSETLKKSFVDCVIPAKTDLYPAIMARVAEMSQDIFVRFRGED